MEQETGEQLTDLSSKVKTGLKMKVELELKLKESEMEIMELQEKLHLAVKGMAENAVDS